MIFTTIRLDLHSTNLDILKNLLTRVSNQSSGLFCHDIYYFFGVLLCRAWCIFCVCGIIVYIWNMDHITWLNMPSRIHMYLPGNVLGLSVFVLVNVSLYYWMQWFIHLSNSIFHWCYPIFLKMFHKANTIVNAPKV